MITILVIDDDRMIQTILEDTCHQQGYQVVQAFTAEQGIQAFQANRPDVVLIDIRLPDLSGLEVFRKLKETDGKVLGIFITGSSESDVAIEAIKLGSFDYLVKPLDLGKVKGLLQRALQTRHMMSVPVKVGKQSQSPSSASEDVFIGTSPGMQEVYKAIGRAAPHDISVLIRGESGTGKELVARALYQHSQRSDRSFIAINCAAIPEPLLESELFGHEKGAFTGADRVHIGKFEKSNGGTIFLDEIGDMPAALQAKLLRVLQDQSFQRIGGHETINTDVRILAATHKDLEQAIAQGKFRADLYYRLNSFEIHLPALRERKEDISELVHFFLGRYGEQFAKPIRQVSEEAMERMVNYSWPGNIRELQNVLKQGVLQATGPILGKDCLPGPIRTATPVAEEGSTGYWEAFTEEQLRNRSTTIYADALEQMERNLLSIILEHTSGRQLQAAELLGITRGSLRHKLKALNMHPDQSGES